MKCDDVGLLSSKSAKRAVAESYVTMRSAVKSVAANAVAAIEVIWNGVEIRVIRNRMVKRCIEDCDLRSFAAERFSRRGDSFQVIRIMQRREIDSLFEAFQDSFIDQL